MSELCGSATRRRIEGIMAVACLVAVAGIASAADRPAASAALPADRLVLTGVDGTARGFDALLGADGQAVCFAFLKNAKTQKDRHNP